MHMIFLQIIFVWTIFKNNHDLPRKIDHDYFFIPLNYASKLMGINKKGAVIAMGIIAFMIAIGFGNM